MDSGLFTQVLTSPEVIVTSLALILLLPLVFFIASTRSRRRLVRVVPRSARGRTGSSARGAARRPSAAAAPARDAGAGRSDAEPPDLDDRPEPRRAARGEDAERGDRREPGERARGRDEDQEPEDRA